MTNFERIQKIREDGYPKVKELVAKKVKKPIYYSDYSKPLSNIEKTYL